MAKILKFKDTNVLDFCTYKKNKEKQGMTEKEFHEKYMKDSVVSKFGKNAMEIFNNKNKK